MMDKWRSGSRRALVFTLLGAVVGLILVGCRETDPPNNSRDTGNTEECQLDRDCPVGERCDQGDCVPLGSGCVDDLDCDAGACVMGECVASGDTGAVDVADGGTGDVRDAGQCSGCFASMGEESRICVTGTHNEACGQGGGPCTQCASDEFCERGTCKERTCTPESCDGCCKNDQCVSGDADDACGTGGEICETCSGNASCEMGECVAPCSERCEGCCTEDGECLEGNSKMSCGTGGEACQSCAMGEQCRGGCVEVDCESTCQGCCVDGTCKDGTADEACGRDGDACQSCADAFGCDSRATGGVCALQDDSTWNVVAARGEVPAKRKVNQTFGGTEDEKWDSLSKPDVFLKISNDAASKSAKTSSAKDSLEPSWKETTIENVRAKHLTGSPKTALKLVDDDVADNDLIAKCKIQFKAKFGKGQFDGKSHEFVCKHTHAGEEITTKVWLRLERQ